MANRMVCAHAWVGVSFVYYYIATICAALIEDPACLTPSNRPRKVYL